MGANFRQKVRISVKDSKTFVRIDQIPCKKLDNLQTKHGKWDSQCKKIIVEFDRLDWNRSWGIVENFRWTIKLGFRLKIKPTQRKTESWK